MQLEQFALWNKGMISNKQGPIETVSKINWDFNRLHYVVQPKLKSERLKKANFLALFSSHFTLLLKIESGISRSQRNSPSPSFSSSFLKLRIDASLIQYIPTTVDFLLVPPTSPLPQIRFPSASFSQRPGLQEMSVKQEKSRCNKTTWKPSYWGWTK